MSSDKPNQIIAYPELDSVGGSEVSMDWSARTREIGMESASPTGMTAA